MTHCFPEAGSFLHVGCGPKRAEQTPFAGLGWRKIKLDIDPQGESDGVGTTVDMGAVNDGSVDAVFSSHNIEHLYPHEVPLALAEGAGNRPTSGIQQIRMDHKNKQHYIAFAVELAERGQELRDVRSNLATSLRNSNLCNAETAWSSLEETIYESITKISRPTPVR